MNYVALADYTPNIKRKNAAILLLQEFKEIMEDVKSRLPYNENDWQITENLFGKDEYSTGYHYLREILIKIRDSGGAKVEVKTIERVILLVTSQAETLLEFSQSSGSPFKDKQKNYGIILAGKMGLLVKNFKIKGLLENQ